MFRKSIFGSRATPHRQPRSLDRRRLERAGWRTTLEFKENHCRTDAGQLLRIEERWLAEAERIGADGVDVVCASAHSEARAWARVASAVLESALEPAGGSVGRSHDLGVRDLRPIS